MEHRLNKEQLKTLKSLSKSPIKFESATKETQTICRYLVDLGMAKFLSVNMMRVGAEITEAGKAHLCWRVDNSVWRFLPILISSISLVLSILSIVLTLVLQ